MKEDMQGERLRAARASLRIRAARSGAAAVHEAEGALRSAPAPQRPPTAGSRPGGAGDAPLPPLDARTLGWNDLRREMQRLGLDTGIVTEYLKPPETSVNPVIAARAEHARVAADARREERATAIAAGSIDARTATVEEVRDRLRSLGLDVNGLGNSFRPPGKPQVAPPAAADGPRMARAAAEQSVRRMLASGQPIDTRRLSADEVEAYRRLKGVAPR